MFKRALMIGVISVVAGCAAQSQPLPVDQTFKVEWIGERPLIDRSHLTVRFSPDGRASGSAGCNQWMSNYEVAGKQLSLKAPAGTRKLCAESLMEQENRFLKTLGEINSWSFDGDGALHLHTQDGHSIKLFAESP